jgi:large subunit ribosomal protein L9
MKVLFLKHVINVWKEGEIKEVKSWYASNFLLPKWLVVELTKTEEQKYNQKIKKEDTYKRWLIENRHNLSEQLNWKSISFCLKAWENWKIYGWIWEKDIINEIKEKFKIELSKKHIDLPDWHIKKLWETLIYIKLWKDAMAKMNIIVKSS